VVATANPTSRTEDITSKLVLSNVEVLAAGTRGRQAGHPARLRAAEVAHREEASRARPAGSGATAAALC
jgi:hypothetical protein